MKKIRLGVIYGSKSVEHEVSVITALQLIKHVDPQKYDVVPIYIDKKGRWLTGPALLDLSTYNNLEKVYECAQPILAVPDAKVSTMPDHTTLSLDIIDVAIVCCHGTLGEDGTVQGLLELAGIPYQGPGVLGSSTCMDKIMTKQILQHEGYPVTKFMWFHAFEWKENKNAVLKRAESLQFPLYIKPSNLGSSIGITKAKDKKGLLEAIDIALHFDNRILVEEEAVDHIEINCSVLGYTRPIASMLEQPIKTGEILSYADKYERGGKKSGMASLDRRIPAPISSALTKKIQETALHTFRTLDLSGVVRIDFLVDPIDETFFINEVNTIPGSMSFYLWEPSGVSYTKLIDTLIEAAFDRQKARSSFIQTISTNILKNASF